MLQEIKYITVRRLYLLRDKQIDKLSGSCILAKKIGCNYCTQSRPCWEGDKICDNDRLRRLAIGAEVISIR